METAAGAPQRHAESTDARGSFGPVTERARLAGYDREPRCHTRPITRAGFSPCIFARPKKQTPRKSRSGVSSCARPAEPVPRALSACANSAGRIAGKTFGGGTCFVDVELDVQISLPVLHACLSARQQSESVRSRRAGGGLWGRSWLCAAPRGTRVAIWQLYQPQDLAMWP